MVGVGVFLLVLVGTQVTPWPVLDKKVCHLSSASSKYSPLTS